jgi:hypothetical protein
MHHAKLISLGAVLILGCGACSGNGGSEASGGADPAGNNGAVSADDTLSLPADCSGSYECVCYSVGNDCYRYGEHFKESWLVRKGRSCFWQVPPQADVGSPYERIDAGLSTNLSDPSVVIDGRLFSIRRPDGSIHIDCWPEVAPN